MSIPYTCNEYVQSPHCNTGTSTPADCCRTCGKTKEAHELYIKFKNERTVIWNNRKYTFKDIEEMMKNRFFTS